MLRKPYVIGRWMYSNGVRVPYVSRINQEGYLAHSNWVWNDSNSQLLPRRSHLPRRVRLLPHAGRLPAARKTLLAGRDRANIGNFITMLHDYKPDSPYRRFMPPMIGTKQDIDDLANFLNAQVNPPAPAAQKPVQTAQR